MQTSDDLEQSPTNITRRVFGVALGMLPLAFLMASAAFGFLHKSEWGFLGVGFMIPAAAVALINFYHSHPIGN